jgi:flavin reductase (DIM6/NTAB) family NADH-FMN oxidoreductase RutF
MHIDLSKADEKDRYKLLMSSILPRPIALVTTQDDRGRVNAAPFSFFNIMASTPAIIVLGIDSKSPGVPKDTVRNMQLTGEFVVNMVSEDIGEKMSLCATPLPEGEDELKFSGLTAAPSIQVKPPRIAESPINMECRIVNIMDIGNDRNIVIGNVVHYHIDDQFYDAEHGYVLVEKLGLIARMHGKSFYLRSKDIFEIERPVGSSSIKI